MQYLYWPLDKIFVTQGFGLNPGHYAMYGMKGHDGIDLRTRFSDSPLARRYVSASQDGVVEVSRWDVKGYGVHIRVRHNDGSMTIYGHLTKPYVSKGDKVKAQQIIGLTGNTGDSSGPHLHWEYRPAGWEKNTKNGYGGAVDQTPFILSTMPKQFMV
jgi:murein DD-endopeptidase MepM/ murein hydrolase activator NlpD